MISFDVPVGTEVPMKLERISRKGKYYNIAGVAVELFKVKVLSEALGRSRERLHTWEEEGLFPKPLYVVKSGNERTRWYSGVQIMNCNKVWKKFGYRKRLDKVSKEFQQKFFDELKAAFYMKELLP